MSDEVIIFYPNKQPDGERFAYHRLPHRPGQDLTQYLRGVHLVALRKRARCVLDGTSLPLRLTYVPRPGDRIVMSTVRSV